MFDVGFTELMLIGIVALVVIGPERLPDVARTVGKWIGKMQRFVRGVKTDIAKELDSGELKQLIGDQREQIDELRKMVGSTARDLESTTRDAVRGARKSLNEMEDAAGDAEADADAKVTRPAKALPAEGSAAAAARTIGQVPAGVATESDTTAVADPQDAAGAEPSSSDEVTRHNESGS